jgi:hypothetical protein
VAQNDIFDRVIGLMLVENRLVVAHGRRLRLEGRLRNDGANERYMAGDSRLIGSTRPGNVAALM